MQKISQNSKVLEKYALSFPYFQEVFKISPAY